jgi:hypothetical protein
MFQLVGSRGNKCSLGGLIGKYWVVLQKKSEGIAVTRAQSSASQVLGRKREKVLEIFKSLPLELNLLAVLSSR